MGLEVKMLQGRRITDHDTLELITGVMGGIVNQAIVACLRQHAVSAVGLTGVDASISTSHKRPPIDANGILVDFGYVGEIEHIDPSLITLLIQSSFVPVIASLTWSPEDGILNVNADTFANRLALELSCTTMIALMDVPAVRDSSGQALQSLSKNDFQAGKSQGWIKDGMIPKLTTAFDAIDAGLPEVILTNVDGLIEGLGTTLKAKES
jgi:acetylglutamate kinase